MSSGGAVICSGVSPRELVQLLDRGEIRAVGVRREHCKLWAVCVTLLQLKGTPASVVGQ